MNKRKIYPLLKYIAIFVWLGILTNTDSYYSIYLLLGIIAIVAVAKKRSSNASPSRLDCVFASLFSAATILSNYLIFAHEAEKGGVNIFLSICSIILSLTCGFIVFYNILPIFRKLTIKTTQKIKSSPAKTFLLCFLVFSLLDILILFLCCYPGTLTPDSINEVEQILSGHYSNHHPFYYTMLIYPFVSIGTNVFHDINIGIALFNVFQILILSAAFSYSISTLYRIGVSKKILYPLTFILALLPYNIIYSFTVWKDVLFGAFFLIFIVAIYRYINGIQPYKRSGIVQLLLIITSGIAVCLFRSNALLAIFASSALFFVIFKKKYLKLGVILVLVVIVSFILKRPVLQSINVKQTDLIESLSIPSQQIVKTLKYQKDQLPKKDLSLINNLADIDELVTAYNPNIHDPIKKVIREEGDQTQLKEHAIDYILLYFKLGLRYPLHYLTAWIDQTRGYWNGGYHYWVWIDDIQTNNYGIERRNNILLNKIFNFYLKTFQQIPLTQPLISVGLIAWLAFILLYRNIIAKNRANLFLLTLILTTWATLLIATPVFCEFRYAYFMFTTAPFLVIATFAKRHN